MKQRYALPNDKECAFAAEHDAQVARAEDLRNQLVSRLMEIEDPKALQSLILYVDNAILKTDSFDSEWSRSISVEDFRKQCHAKLKEMYG